MQALFREIHAFFKAFHPFCKRILKMGCPLVFSLFFTAGFCRLAAGQIGVYDKMLRLASEFFLCGREMFGAVVVFSLLLQLLCMAYAYDHGHMPMQ